MKAPPLSTSDGSAAQWLNAPDGPTGGDEGVGPSPSNGGSRRSARPGGRGPFPEFDGRVTAILFWSIGCEASWDRLNELAAARDRLPGLSVVAVHSPRYGYERDPDVVGAQLERRRVDVPVLHDPDLIVWGRYNPGGWPATVLVDHRGRALGAVLGLHHLDPLLDAAEECLLRAAADAQVPVPRPVRDVTGDPRLRGGSQPLAWPSGIASLPGGRIAVADANDRILVFGLDSQHRRGECLQVVTGLDQPSRVASLGDDSLVASLPRSGSVVGVDLRGDGRGDEPTVTVLADDLGRPQGIVEDLDGSIVVCDAAEEQLLRITLDGHIGVIAGTSFTGTADGRADRAELAQPVAVARADAGLAFLDAGSNRLRVLTDAGEVVSVSSGDFDRRGLVDGPVHNALLQRPTGLAVRRSDGLVVVADTGNNRLRTIANRRIRTLGVVGLARPEDVAFVGEDHVIIADTGNHRLVVAELSTHRVWPLTLRLRH